MIRLLLLVASIVVFVLLAFKVLDTNLFQWQNGALALGFASLLPFNDPPWR